MGGLSFDNMGQTIFHIPAGQENLFILQKPKPCAPSSAFEVPTLKFEVNPGFIDDSRF